MTPLGELHGRAKVTRKQVAWIRRPSARAGTCGGHHEIPGSVSHMARVTGISRRQVMRIVKGENW